MCSIHIYSQTEALFIHVNVCNTCVVGTGSSICIKDRNVCMLSVKSCPKQTLMTFRT